MGEINNEKLIQAIEKLKEEKSNEAQNLVISEVLKTRFLCPVILENAPKGGGKIEVNKDTKLQFSIIRTNDNRNFLIAFTSDGEVQKWQQSKVQQSIVYTFEDYATVITGNDSISGFVIDPKGCNIVFTKEMIVEIRKHVTKETVVEENTEVQVGIPKEYPEELAKKLHDIFVNLGDVKKAYLLLMTKDEERSYLLVIDADGKEKDYFNNIASASIPFLNGVSLNLLPLNTEFGRRIAQDFTPFFVI